MYSMGHSMDFKSKANQKGVEKQFAKLVKNAYKSLF